MPTVMTQTAKAPELFWLSGIQERCYPLNEHCPLWVRHGVVEEGPTCVHPERHPYYEIGINFSGVVTQFVRVEKAERLAGDLFLAGPGLPHYSKGIEYPHHYATVYFLPSVLLGMGPSMDSAKVLRRFTMRQKLSSHLVRPSPQLRDEMIERFRTMIHEFEGKQTGREMKIRSILTGLIVELLRWEEESGNYFESEEATSDWKCLDRAMSYLHDHFKDPVYANDLGRHVGVSESRLKVLFRDSLGIPWSHYLQWYRVHRALDLLGIPGQNISEAALAVGFQSLSHFNATFRSVMGLTPREYLHKTKISGEAKIAKGLSNNGRFS